MLGGGTLTTATGLIAHGYGSVLGGLFLAFPAVPAASPTLIEERTEHGPGAAAIAAGADIGTAGLAAFGAVVWASASRAPARLVLLAALFGRTVVSLTVWVAFEPVLRPGAARARSTDGS